MPLSNVTYWPPSKMRAADWSVPIRIWPFPNWPLGSWQRSRQIRRAWLRIGWRGAGQLAAK
eukprot:scaffold77634_cov35-Tisochrysis_lutea.AAC.1